MLWILADAHGGADAEADEQLLRLLDRAADRDVDLLILGDLFASWIALDRFLTPYQRAVLDRLRMLKIKGAKVTFVVGNRDYMVAEGQGDKTFTEVVDHEARMTIAGVDTLVLHGDRINPDDRLYAAWHRLSRSRPSRLLAKLMPPGVGQTLAERTERAMRDTNQAYKTSALPMDALESLGRRAAHAGAEQVLVGHFHADRTVQVSGGAPVVIAPAWLDHRKILVADGDRLDSVAQGDV